MLVGQWFAPETRPDNLSTPTYLQPQESQEVAHPKGSDRELQEFHSFVTLSPSSSLRCLFLSRFLPTSSGSCRCSRPHVFLPPLHLSPSALSPLRLFSLSLFSLAPSLAPLFLLLRTLCFPPSSFLSAPSISLVPPLSSFSSTPSIFIFIFSYLFSPSISLIPPLSSFSILLSTLLPTSLNNN